MSYSIPRIDHMHLTDCFTVSRKEGADTFLVLRLTGRCSVSDKERHV